MQVFLTWSEHRSCLIAEALRNAISRVFRGSVTPIFSRDDVEKGLAWFDEIVAHLNRSDIGIACLTPESLKSPWLHMEIGVLYQVLHAAQASTEKDIKILPYIFELSEKQLLKHPLSHFQCTYADKQDTRLLFRTINNTLRERGSEGLTDEDLDRRFEECWLQLAPQLSQLERARQPLYGVFQHQLALGDSIGRGIDAIVQDPAKAGNLTFHRLFEDTIGGIVTRVDRFTQRAAVDASMDELFSVLRRSAGEERVTLRILRVLEDKDDISTPVPLTDTVPEFERICCATVVGDLNMVRQLCNQGPAFARRLDLRLLSLDNFRREFPSISGEFALIDRSDETEILVRSKGSRLSSGLSVGADPGDIARFDKFWEAVWGRSVELPESADAKQIADTIDAVSRPLNVQVTEPELVAVEGGDFLMGSPPNEPGRFDDEDRHPVEIPRNFMISVYPITFEQYDEFVRAESLNPPSDESGQRGRRPVFNVSWGEATRYAKWLSEMTGRDYRLPTEAEWEYAARAGDWESPVQTSASGNDAVHCGQSQDGPVPVGCFPANPWGLHDCLGNVWEWTCSAYDEKYGGGEQVCAGRQNARARVVRGGAWSSPVSQVRYAMRRKLKQYQAGNDVGFRLVSEAAR